MNSAMYLICLINLTGLFLLVFIMDSHTKLHRKLKEIKQDAFVKGKRLEYMSHQINFLMTRHVTNSATNYWILWMVQRELMKIQNQLAGTDDYEKAGSIKKAVDSVEEIMRNCLQELKIKEENDNENENPENVQ